MKKIWIIIGAILLMASLTNAQDNGIGTPINISVTILPDSQRTFSVHVEVVETPREWHCPNPSIHEEWDNITIVCHGQTFASSYTFPLTKDADGNTDFNGRNFKLRDINDSTKTLLIFDYTKVLAGRWDLYNPYLTYGSERVVYNGTIDNLQIYDHALTDEEIHVLYRAGLSNSTTPP